ncbi:MAG: HlyD family efflux transporter periplasmic adaptor subunit [Cyanobacteria bacterium J06629_19]
MTQLLPSPNSKPAADSTAAEHQRWNKVNSKLTKRLRLLIPAILLIVAASLGLRYWPARQGSEAIALSGRIESYESELGAKVGGRVASIAVREGDLVAQGQVIATLDDGETTAQLAAAKASVGVAEQQIIQANLQIDVIASQVQEAQLILEQSQGDTVGRVSQSEAAVAAAQAQLAVAEAQMQQAEAALRLARADRDRFYTLLTQGAIAAQQFDQVQTQFETARDTLAARQATVNAAQQQVNAAIGTLTQARTSRMNPEIRAIQIDRTEKQQAQAQAQLAAAQAELKRAQAAQAEIETRLNELKIKSPIDGVVLTRTVELGEVLSPGTTILTVVNLEEVYLRGYIPEGQVGAVRVGQAAQVFLDSSPNRPLPATVTAIDTEASFTPENIYFEEDRVTQVFGLKLTIDNPQGFAKPGMPADGEILPEVLPAAEALGE